MVKASEINVDFRIDLVKRSLDSTKKQVDRCDLAPLTTPSLIENFENISNNLTLIDVAIDEHQATQEQIKEFERLQSRYYELERDFTYNCNCLKTDKKIGWKTILK